MFNPAWIVSAINGVITILDYIEQTGRLDGKSLASLREARNRLTDIVLANQERINSKGEDFQREEANRNS